MTLGKVSLALILAVCIAVAGIASLYGLRFTITQSMPSGIYKMVSGPVKKGDLVIFCPEPSELQIEARDRGYIPFGTCPGWFSSMLKVVTAVPGDNVAITNQGIVVNGRVVPNTKRFERDSVGRAMPGQLKAGIVQEGQLLLVSDHHPKSYDSRYFGAVNSDSVISRAVPVWILGKGNL